MHRSLPFKYRQTGFTPLELIEYVQQIIPEIEADLVGSLIWYSPNARYIGNSIRIISVEVSGQSRYKMNYSFRCNLFNACLDIDSDQVINQSINFTCMPDSLVFDFIDNNQPTMSEEL